MKRKKSKSETEEERDWRLLAEESFCHLYENEDKEWGKAWDEFAQKEFKLKSKTKDRKHKKKLNMG
ncbi:MAG: hypothetical protein AABX02_04235 [archaeon]